MSSNMLLVDCCNNSNISLNLNEASTDGRVKFRGKLQEAEAENKNKRVYPFTVLDENVKRLKEIVEDRRLVGELDHPCLIDDNFDVLTPEGWKHFKSIKQGDKVFSRINGEMVSSVVNKVINEPYKGTVYKVQGRSIDCTFTAPHKFLVCDKKDREFYVTIDEIHHHRDKYGHDYIPKTTSWEGENNSKFVIPGVYRGKKYLPNLEIETEKFVSFLGLYLAEGYLKNNSNRIEICQKTHYGKNLLRSILTNFSKDIECKEFDNGFYLVDPRLYDYLKPLGNVCEKYIPQNVKNLSSKYLEILVAAFAIGDGRILYSEDKGKTCLNLKEKADLELTLDFGKYSRLSVFSVSEKLIDDLHECIIKSGKSATKTVVEDAEDYIFAERLIQSENKKPLHCLNITKNKGIYLDKRFLKTIEDYYEGNIYCLDTDYGNFYMRYNGKSFWTGNCDSIIHFANASHIITKLWWEGNVLMGEGEILNTPHGKVLKALINDGVKIGMSSRGVGNGRTNENGILVISEGYKLITFDAVADPSTFKAFQEKVKENFVHQEIDNYSNNVIKNEASSVNKVSKDLFLAYLESIVKSNTSRIKREI